MTVYQSLTGGFYSDTTDRSLPVSIRFNNPGAVNSAGWEKQMPGHVGERETTPGNRSTIFSAPEYGCAVYYTLLQKYRAVGAVTLQQIVNRYGGGQDYSAYVAFVCKQTGLPPHSEIRLTGDDTRLLAFAKAMFRYEAGRPIPWSDAQILYGFNLVRGKAAAPAPGKKPVVALGIGAVLAAAAHVAGAHPIVAAVLLLGAAAVAALLWARRQRNASTGEQP